MADPISERQPYPPLPGRRYAWLWPVGGLLYVAILWYVGWDDLRKGLASIQPLWLGAMVVVEIAILWGRAGKWRFGLGPGKQAVRLYFMAKAGGNLTPGRVGELSPLLLPRHRSPRTAAWIVLDRLFEIAATLVIGVLGAAIVGVALSDTLRVTPWTLAAGWGAAMAGMVLLPLLLVTRSGWIETLRSRLPAGSRSERVAGWVAEASREARLFRAKLPAVAVLTLLATAIDVAIGFLLYRSFGYAVPFALLAAAQCLHALVSVVPVTPNATGVPYLAAALLLHELGGVPAEALALAVPVRMIIAGGLFWLSFAVAMSGTGDGADG